MEDWSDLLAERAGALGLAAERSHLTLYPLSIADGQAHLAALSDALAAFAGEARNGIGDADSLGDLVTADILTGIVRAADQALWKLESHQEPA